ncbi:MAG: hypothetical protein R6X06_05105, partial [Gammaproteobacteria bacterium]
MMTTTRLNLFYLGMVITVTLVLAGWLVFFSHPHDPAHDDGHGHDSAAPRGPQGGRLLSQKDLALEITIFEQGLPPEFHVYAYADGKPLPPDAITLRIDLTRLDGQVDRFDFVPQDDFLRGRGVVTEPHSFDV